MNTLTKLRKKFDGKTVLITGATGSLGRCALKVILDQFAPKEIRALSRGEAKQQEVKDLLSTHRVNFKLGDITKPQDVGAAMRGVHIVLHFAAMKRVERCEDEPDKALEVNCNGAQIIAAAAQLEGVEDIIAMSTDKSCDPSTTYGFTKALGEKFLLASSTPTKIIRSGNFAGSDGSIFQRWVEAARAGANATAAHSSVHRPRRYPGCSHGQRAGPSARRDGGASHRVRDPARPARRAAPDPTRQRT